MTRILDEILKNLPEKAKISDASFEGANIVLYTKNKDFFFDDQSTIREIVNNIKKRIELRPDPSLCMDMEKAKIIIEKIVPAESLTSNVIFDPQRSRVIIESEKPGLAIGKQGEILKEIKKQTLWVPTVRRTPAIRSKIIDNIRQVLYEESEYRKKFLNKVGHRIYDGWIREKKHEWVRLSYLGAGREVGRSCLFLQTPESRILLDCGLNPAATSEDQQYPYLDAPEFKIDDLDAVIISHSHLDHCGLVPFLYKMGYKGPCYMSVDYKEPILIKEDGKIKKIKIGEFIDKTIDIEEDKERYPLYEYTASTPNTNIEAIAFSNSDYKLGFKKIKKVIRHKICKGDKLYKITVKTNRNITVTGSHSVFILKNGEIKESKVNELSTGDYLVVPQRLPTNIIEEINFGDIVGDFKSDKDYIYVKQGHKIPIIQKEALYSHHTKERPTQKHPCLQPP